MLKLTLGGWFFLLVDFTIGYIHIEYTLKLLELWIAR